jgi:uncharacterized protein YndB with AHSA1/START domain
MVDTDNWIGGRPPPLVISRTFAAPRALVFQAWSTADHIKRWFSPETCSVPKAEIEFRVGGVFVVCMRLPDDAEHWCHGTFTELSPPERLAFTVDVSEGGPPKFTVQTTVTFEEHGGATRMTVRQSYELHDKSQRGPIEGAAEGWRTTLDKLEAELVRMQGGVEHSAVHGSFTVERVYAAAPATVFHALTDPTAKARWFSGGDAYVVLESAMDVRPGGRELVKGRWANGMETTFDAVYFDVIANERLVYAYEMHLDERKISVSLATVQLHAVDAGTRIVVTEHGVFLDGYNDAGSREHGTGFLLDRLGAALSG